MSEPTLLVDDPHANLALITSLLPSPSDPFDASFEDERNILFSALALVRSLEGISRQELYKYADLMWREPPPVPERNEWDDKTDFVKRYWRWERKLARIKNEAEGSGAEAEGSGAENGPEQEAVPPDADVAENVVSSPGRKRNLKGFRLVPVWGREVEAQMKRNRKKREKRKESKRRKAERNIPL